MSTEQLEALKYPIGRFKAPHAIDQRQIESEITRIESLPTQLRDLAKDLNDEQLDTPYRPEGWTVRQVIHHLPDSHTNGYIRFKWTLTEETPMIKAYNEQEWSALSDAVSAPIGHSLNLLEALHVKWVYLLKGLSIDDFKRRYIHPETKQEVSLYTAISLYAWHGEHHYMHIRRLCERMDWLK